MQLICVCLLQLYIRKQLVSEVLIILDSFSGQVVDGQVVSNHLVAPFNTKSNTFDKGAYIDSSDSSVEESNNVADDDADWDLDTTSDELEDLLVTSLQCQEDCCEGLLGIGGADLFESDGDSKVEGLKTPVEENMRDLVVHGQTLDDRDNFVGSAPRQNLSSNIVYSETINIDFDERRTIVPSSVHSPLHSDAPNISVRQKGVIPHCGCPSLSITPLNFKKIELALNFLKIIN